MKETIQEYKSFFKDFKKLIFSLQQSIPKIISRQQSPNYRRSKSLELDKQRQSQVCYQTSRPSLAAQCSLHVRSTENHVRRANAYLSCDRFLDDGELAPQERRHGCHVEREKEAAEQLQDLGTCLLRNRDQTEQSDGALGGLQATAKDRQSRRKTVAFG